MQTKQRGSGWSIKLVYNLYNIFGYSFIYFLMFPVTFFYFIFANNVYFALKIYYENLDINFTKKLYFDHLFKFALCMVDRFISRFSPENYNFSYENKEKLVEDLSRGTVLLLSHFGGWATASNSIDIDNKINIVMKEALMQDIKDIENSIKNNTSKNVNIIDLNKGGLEYSVKILNALDNEEVVAMMADRPLSKRTSKAILFLNKDAYFNKSPFQLAYKTKKPIVAIFVVHTQIQSYQILRLSISIDYSLEENEAITQAMFCYVKKLEAILKQYPTQWFNFYNFWEK